MKKRAVLAIDPGLTGAIVYLTEDDFEHFPMPLRNKEVSFEGVLDVLKQFPKAHIYLERAMPLAMGAKHAFNYGRGFAAIEIAVELSRMPVTYVEPAKWTKLMHEGISNDLKPKAKSAIAVERLFPLFSEQIPRSNKGKLDEGVVDALLIAGYGFRV